MDRLPAVRLAALALGACVLAGCGGSPAGDAPAPSRFESVKATSAPVDPARWCDAFFPADQAPPLVWPRIEPARAGGALPAASPDRWTWINLWATWCGPCRHEMPVLVRWREALQREGVPFELVFVSIDDTSAVLRAFLAANPATAPDPSVRMLAQKDLGAWLGRYQKDPSTSIPIQVIVAPPGRVRCIRAGSLREGDWPLVRALVR